MQDLREVSGRLEGCSYGTSSMGLTSKTSHTHTPNHNDIEISADCYDNIIIIPNFAIYFFEIPYNIESTLYVKHFKLCI